MTPNDPQATIIATAVVRLNATLPAANPDKAESYTIDFGEKLITIKAGGDLRDLWGAVSGIVGKVKKKRVKPTLSYEWEENHLPKELLGYYFGTDAAGGAPSPGKVLEFYGYVALQMEDEPTVAAGTNAGESIMKHHSFLCALTVDGDLEAKGEDYAKPKVMLDVLLGRARGATAYGTRPIRPTT